MYFAEFPLYYELVKYRRAELLAVIGFSQIWNCFLILTVSVVNLACLGRCDTREHMFDIVIQLIMVRPVRLQNRFDHLSTIWQSGYYKGFLFLMYTIIFV